MSYHTLIQFTENIYTLDAPQNFKGVDMGTRMTIVRLPNGQLWLHSPVPITTPIKQQIDALGEVGYIIAPNKMHHLYIEDIAQHYPHAAIYVAPDLTRKLAKLNRHPHITAELDNNAPDVWSDVFEQKVIAGLRWFEEVVFLHKPSKTLIVTDAIYDLSSSKRWYLKPIISTLKLKQPRGLFAEVKYQFIPNDEPTIIPCLQDIAQWDFTNLIVAHGKNIKVQGKQVFVDAYRKYARLE